MRTTETLTVDDIVYYQEEGKKKKESENQRWKVITYFGECWYEIVKMTNAEGLVKVKAHISKLTLVKKGIKAQREEELLEKCKNLL